jgi:hypothetical protein
MWIPSESFANPSSAREQIMPAEGTPPQLARLDGQIYHGQIGVTVATGT